MAKCNDNVKLSSEAVSACMRRCEQPLQEVNHVVQQEVGSIQARATCRLHRVTRVEYSAVELRVRASSVVAWGTAKILLL